MNNFHRNANSDKGDTSVTRHAKASSATSTRAVERRPRRPRALAALGAALALAMALSAASAQAATYNQTGQFTPDTGSIYAMGIAIDQFDGSVYVADAANPTFEHGFLKKYDAQGNNPTTVASDLYYSGVAVDPTNRHVYAFGPNPATSGEAQIAGFTSAGTALGSPFPLSPTGAIYIFHGIATDSSGDIYYPDSADNTVKKIDPATGATLLSIDCSACSPAGFSPVGPTGETGVTSVAVDPQGNVYVVDRGNDRVVKFDSSGQNPTVFQSGTTPEAVAVDPATGNVFVLDEAGGVQVIAYDSQGNEIGFFGAGTIGTGTNGFVGDLQLAVNASTGDVYVTDDTQSSGDTVWIYSPVLPTATTGAPTAVSQAAATLNGTIDPNLGGDITDCHFQWGTDTGYTGGTVPCASNPPDGNSAAPVSAALSGLSASTTYHYQLVVDNGTGPRTGGDQTLTTLPNPPTVTTGGSSAVSQTAATIAGTINPGGVATTDCHFEYGTTVAYGTNVPCPSAAGSGGSDVAESLGLTGLSANATYHYRLVGKNAGGTKNGDDATFTTLADTCQTNAALCPPPAVTPPVNPPTNPAAYKVCVKKATKAYKKAKSKARSAAARKAAKAKEKKAIKKCASRFL